MALIIGARFIAHAPTHKNTWLIVGMLIGSICYVLSARQDYQALIPNPFGVQYDTLFPFLNIMRNASTAFFMLLCYSIFRDGSPAPKTLLALFAIQLLLEEPLAWLIGPDWSAANATLSLILMEVIPAAIQIVFLGTALFLMLNERDADLVDSRRKARVFLIIIYIAQVFLSLAIERVAFSLNVFPLVAMYPIHMLITLLAVLTSVAILFSLMSPQKVGLVLYPEPAKQLAPSPPSELTEQNPSVDTSEQDATRIRRALTEDKIYQQAGLSVGQLAQHLALPEYRLRILIHEHMGFRNFNALLHHYRVNEVATALADPALNKTPILTLALSAGYQSINPFNRAFREMKAKTPSAFRRDAQKAPAEY